MADDELKIEWPEGAESAVHVWFRGKGLRQIHITGADGQTLFEQELAPEIRTVRLGKAAVFQFSSRTNEDT
jgi:hypothetical protein